MYMDGLFLRKRKKKQMQNKKKDICEVRLVESDDIKKKYLSRYIIIIVSFIFVCVCLCGDGGFKSPSRRLHSSRDD